MYNAILDSNLIGLVAIVYEPLYHSQEIVTIKNKLSSGCSCKAKSARSSNLILGCFNRTIIPLALVGYEMIIANLVLHAFGYLSSHIQGVLKQYCKIIKIAII